MNTTSNLRDVLHFKIKDTRFEDLLSLGFDFNLPGAHFSPPPGAHLLWTKKLINASRMVSLP